MMKSISRIILAIVATIGFAARAGVVALEQDLAVATVPGAAAAGGDIVTYTENGTKFIAHIFTEDGIFEPFTDLEVEYLIVGGGGGGGGSHDHGSNAGGGGGAGGLLEGTMVLAVGSETIVVGAGGAGGRGGRGTNPQPGNPGEDSSAFGLTALGGGGGGTYYGGAGDGGSGGGAGSRGGLDGGARGEALLGGSQGYDGGARVATNSGAASGGGAGGPGANTTNSNAGRPGGAAVTRDITGVDVKYAGGGGGGGSGGGGTSETGGVGGVGSTNGSDAWDNTGGGGGGGGSNQRPGGNGGSGIVIVRYQVPPEPSPTASTVEASPTSVPADGVTTSTITVTLLADDGETPVADRQVELESISGPGDATISPGLATTNADGVAEFTVSSGTASTEEFRATDITGGEPGIIITRTASVEFLPTLMPQTSLIPGYTPPAPPAPDAPQTSLAPTTAPPPEPNVQAVPEASDPPEPLATVTGPIRVTEYYLTEGDFAGTAATLVLDQDLAADYFILVRGSRAGSGLSMPDNDYARVAAVPGGRGGLADSGAADAIALQRAAVAFDWEGVVTVVECTVPGSPAGFRLVDAVVTTLSGTSGSQVCAPWGDASRVVPFGGYRGGGAELTGGAANRYQGTSVYVRLSTSGNDTLDWQRDAGGETLVDATMTTFVVEWGADWTVQHAAVAGSAGGDGADATEAYTTAAIDPVARANTWVWGTGMRANSGIGTCAESCVVTLGDGVTLNATESTVAVGSEYTDAYSFDVYALTHPELAVDHRFKPDGDLKGLDIPVAVAPAVPGARFAWLYNGCNGTSSRFPRPRMWSRYTAADTVTVSRGYDGAQFPAWVQGIDFSALSE